MRDTAIERRSLTSAQRIDIILRSSDLIDEILEKSKSNQGKRNDLTSESEDSEVKNERTNAKLAELANTSAATVQRMKRVKNESPELYDQVVKGEKTIRGAYNELPTTVTPKKSSEYPSHQKPTTKFTIPEPEPMTEDEKATLYASANLNLNFNQIVHYVADNSEEKIYEAIEKNLKRSNVYPQVKKEK